MARARTGTAEDKAIGRELRALRKLAGWSQTRLGEAVPCTYQQISKYERGVSSITQKLLDHMRKSLQAEIGRKAGNSGSHIEGFDEDQAIFPAVQDNHFRLRALLMRIDLKVEALREDVRRAIHLIGNE